MLLKSWCFGATETNIALKRKGMFSNIWRLAVLGLIMCVCVCSHVPGTGSQHDATQKRNDRALVWKWRSLFPRSSDRHLDLQSGSKDNVAEVAFHRRHRPSRLGSMSCGVCRNMSHLVTDIWRGVFFAPICETAPRRDGPWPHKYAAR